MKKQEVTINGIRYNVSSTTERGLKAAIRMLKKSLKDEKKRDDDKNNEQEHAI